jgi:hypothetical protein
LNDSAGGEGDICEPIMAESKRQMHIVAFKSCDIRSANLSHPEIFDEIWLCSIISFPSVPK